MYRKVIKLFFYFLFFLVLSCKTKVSNTDDSGAIESKVKIFGIGLPKNCSRDQIDAYKQTVARIIKDQSTSTKNFLIELKSRLLQSDRKYIQGLFEAYNLLTISHAGIYMFTSIRNQLGSDPNLSSINDLMDLYTRSSPHDPILSKTDRQDEEGVYVDFSPRRDLDVLRSSEMDERFRYEGLKIRHEYLNITNKNELLRKIDDDIYGLKESTKELLLAYKELYYFITQFETGLIFENLDLFERTFISKIDGTIALISNFGANDVDNHLIYNSLPFTQVAMDQSSLDSDCKSGLVEKIKTESEKTAKVVRGVEKASTIVGLLVIPGIVVATLGAPIVVPVLLIASGGLLAINGMMNNWEGLALNSQIELAQLEELDSALLNSGLDLTFSSSDELKKHRTSALIAGHVKVASGAMTMYSGFKQILSIKKLVQVQPRSQIAEEVQGTYDKRAMSNFLHEADQFQLSGDLGGADYRRGLYRWISRVRGGDTPTYFRITGEITTGEKNRILSGYHSVRFLDKRTGVSGLTRVENSYSSGTIELTFGSLENAINAQKHFIKAIEVSKIDSIIVSLNKYDYELVIHNAPGITWTNFESKGRVFLEGMNLLFP